MRKLTRLLFNRLLIKPFKQFYYNARESIGDHKRMQVVAQVEQACVGLEETRDEFANALERFKGLVIVGETGLEHKYQLLNRQYQFCRAKTDAISHRIEAIDEVTKALFAEWERELNDYTNRSLKSKSKQQLKTARQNYARLLKTLRRAEAVIQPVLAAFKDQVLYLKHNLNAHAIAALQHEFVEMSIDISQLIAAMEQTIAEANRFVASLTDSPTIIVKSLPKR